MKSATLIFLTAIVALTIAGCRKANPFDNDTITQQQQNSRGGNQANPFIATTGQYTYRTECIGYTYRYDTAYALNLPAYLVAPDSIYIAILPARWGGPLSIVTTFQLDASHHYHGTDHHDQLDIQVNNDSLYYMEVINRCDIDRCGYWNDTSTYVGLIQH